jgi:CysZ protein
MIILVTILLILEFIITGVYWAVTGIIGFHLIDTPVYFLIAAFFYGFSFYDYSLERERIGISGSMNYAFKNSVLILLTGIVFLLSYKIPFIGVIIAPVLTTMISTIVYLKNKTINE